MADDQSAPLAEPLIVGCVFLEGFAVEVHYEVVRVVGWVTLETLEEGAAPERRIVARFVMPTHTARSMIRDMRKKLDRGH